MAIGVGCSRTTTISSAGGTIPSRPPSATYPNWEYFCSSITSGIGYVDELNKMLADAGKQGWELVTRDQGTYCFKRPVLTPLPTTGSPPTS